MMKRRLSMLLCFCAVLLAAVFLQPVTVSAAQETRYCQGCQQDIPLTDWTAIGGEQTETLTLEADKHYYLTSDLTGAPSSGALVSGAGCIDLNGFNITAGTDCIAVSCDGSTTKIMGTGTVTGTYATTAGNGATIHTANGAAVHLYGGTYTKTDVGNPTVYIGENCQVHLYEGAAITATGTYATYASCVYTNQETALFHMHGGTITGGTTTGSSSSNPAKYYAGTGGSVRIHNGSFTMDAGIITGGTARFGGNVSITYGTFTMNGGTITSGTANGTSYGGGNFYVYRGTATMNGGLITEGKAANKCYGGGNVCILTSTFNMYGGTISYGRVENTSCRGGGNIYQGSASSVFNMTGGRVEFGYLVKGSGNNAYINDGKTIFSANAYIGQKHPDTAGSMSYYVKAGGLTASGKTNVTGGLKVMAGDMYISGGKYYSVYYEGSGTCEITGGNFRIDQSSMVADGYEQIKVVDSYAYAVVPKGEKTDTVLVDLNGKESLVYYPLTVFDATKYSYIKVYRDTDMGTTSKEVVIDLNGKNLTIGGTGKVHAFDSANDTYDASACGTLTVTGTMEVVQDVQAPNGNRYIAFAEDGKTSMHRLDMRLTSVSLRPRSTGVYYETAYSCDAILAEKVSSYGVAVSVNNMPGSDFLTEQGDINLYTAYSQSFQSGSTATSVAIINIMLEELDAATNATRGAMTIYPNPYICLDGTTYCVGDPDNAGKVKTDADFTGVAHSLFDVLSGIDKVYDSYDEQTQIALDEFYYTWKDSLAGLGLENIGKGYTNSLTVKNGQAYCPVCQEKVTWTALDQETYAATPYGTATDGTHLYLAEDITYSGTTGNGFLIGPSTSNHKVCLHLNGHSLTGTADRAIYGGKGIINVMGSGIVSGYMGSGNTGAAIELNTTATNGAINLYSGTYRHATGSASGSYVVAVGDNGGIVNVYKDAHVDGSLTGRAIRTGTSYAANNTTLSLYDTVVDGNVYLAGSVVNTSKSVLENTTVNGTLDINSINTVILRGAPVIQTLDIAKTSLITMDNLTTGTNISVIAVGCFTETNSKASTYAKYFTPANSNDKIVAENNTLLCLANYTTALTLDSNNIGYCLVCKKDVTWTALDSATKQLQLTNGQHLYLTGALTYEDSEAPFIVAPDTAGHKACLHLNGNNITATQNIALYSKYGTLNVLGSGTVTGYTDEADRGAAVMVNGADAVINLYSGTYEKYTGSHASAGAAACGSDGGTLNLYADATFATEGDCAVYVATCENANTKLTITGATVKGTVALNAPSGTYQSQTTVDSAAIDTLQVGSGAKATLTGRPVIDNLDVAKDTLVTLSNLLKGTNVGVTADGIFTETNSKIRQWESYFSGADSEDWVVVQTGALSCVPHVTPPNGKKILVIANSQTYHGKYVINKGHVFPLSSRRNDKGYLYQIFKANGVDVSITNFCFGNHTLEDIYSGNCQAGRGHDGHNHLEDLMVDPYYDYVILQEGTEHASRPNIYAECKPMMDILLKANPNTKFILLVPQIAYGSTTHAWLSSIKEMEEHGVIVVDWGKMVQDLIAGNVTPPGAAQTYSKFSFIVNQNAKDGYHPNILAGYIAAQMTYCAIMEESAVGSDYSFWKDRTANTNFDLNAYKVSMYAYDSTRPSNTNFEAIFNSPADMNGLHVLIDQYLKEKPYLEY